jgi:GNAT superfamily N-acetyltransferase
MVEIKKIHEKNRITFHLMEQGKIIGETKIDLYKKDEGSIKAGAASLGSIEVYEGYKNKGYGSKLLKEAESEAQKQGATHMDIFNVDNPDYWSKQPGYQYSGSGRRFHKNFDKPLTVEEKIKTRVYNDRYGNAAFLRDMTRKEIEDNPYEDEPELKTSLLRQHTELKRQPPSVLKPIYRMNVDERRQVSSKNKNPMMSQMGFLMFGKENRPQPKYSPHPSKTPVKKSVKVAKKHTTPVKKQKTSTQKTAKKMLTISPYLRRFPCKR